LKSAKVQLRSAAYWQRGDVYYKKGDFDRALADFNEAIRLNPLNHVYYHNRGDCYQSKKDFDGAIADYTEAIRLDPKRAGAYNDRGVAHCEKGDFDKALADLDEAIRLDPKHALAYCNRGAAHHIKGDFDKALADLDEAIRLDPKCAFAYSNRGSLYIEKGATDEGLRDLSKALELGENDARVWRRVAFGRLAAGRLDEYRGTCSAMLKQFAQTENPEHGSETAWACVLAPDAVGDWSKVVALAEIAQKRDPKSPVCQATLGAVLYRAGRFEEAVQRLTEADRLVPEPMEGARRSPAETWFFLAMAHHRAGHAEEAKKWLDKATAWAVKALREHETRTGPRLDFYRRVMLKRFRAEAADLLGITAKPPAGKEKPEKGK
jgi:tetratricopeptide (TPR) repeat protein